MPFESKQSLPRVRYTLDCEQAPALGWQVRRVAIEEGLSQPYRVVIDVVVPLASEVDVDALLAANAELGIDRDGVLRSLCGVIAQVELRDPTTDQQPLQLVIVPALALLDQRVDTRLWQQMSAIEVVAEVLAAGFGDYGRELDREHLSKSYPTREYIVQYHESDLAFVSRLLEDEGVTYQFDHERGTGCEVMVLEDSSDHWAELPTLDGDASLRVISSRAEQAEIESLQRLTWTRAMRPSAVLRRTFDWQAPTSPIEATSLADDVGPNREVYHHGRIVEPDPQVRASRELIHARAGSRSSSGVGNAIGLAPGRRFRIVAPDRAELDDREFLLTHVKIHGDCPDVELGVELGGSGGSRPAGPEFECEFECVQLDGDVWHPPLRTPIPKIHGPQTAIVTGPAGEEIHTDEHGRVKVRFDWDRQHELTDDTSMWIRVAHGWAGSGFGILFTPRIGMEVVVEFIGGAPERPLITGCVYNGEAQASVALPDSKTQSGIRTSSSPGGGGFNELRFEDAAGSEQIYVHAQRDSIEKVGRNSTSTIGNDRTETIGGALRQTIRGDQELTVEKTWIKTIHGLEVVVNNENRDTTVLGEESIYVELATTAEHKGGVTRTVTSSDVTNVVSFGPHALSRTTVDGNHEVTATNSIKQAADARVEVIQGAPGSGAHATLSGGQMNLGTKKGFYVEAGTDAFIEAQSSVYLKQGAAEVVIEQDSITLSAATLKLVATSSVEIGVGNSKWTLDATGLKIDIAGTVETKAMLVKVN